MRSDNKSKRTNKSILKAYDKQRTAYNPKHKETQEERQRRKRARMIENLDKNRKWISLWDVENGREK